jgi:hypothetical protein
VQAARRLFPRWLRGLARAAFGAAASALAACTLVAETSSLDSGCPAGEKLCSRGCVSTQDPAYGCGSPRCDQPCPQANATARCAPDGSCAIASCSGKYADCNRTPDDGCEVDTAHDPAHCGGCDAPQCVLDHAVAGCGAGKCGVAKCDPDWRDCNTLAADGCEKFVPQGITVCPATP